MGVSRAVTTEFPGVHLKGRRGLPAGTYVFKLPESESDRHIVRIFNMVRIFNKDEMQVRATILAISNYRLRATGETVVTFRERPAGEPEALRAWFYPGENHGQEFVPKTRAVELAKSANAPVFMTAVEVPAKVAELVKPADEPLAEKTLPATASTPPPTALLGLPALAGAGFLGMARRRIQ